MFPGLLRCCSEKNRLLSFKLKNSNQLNISKYKNYSKILVKCKKKAKQMYFLEAFEAARSDLKATWSLIGEVSGRTKTKPKLNKTFIVNGTKSYDKDEIAKGFNNFFGTIGSELASKIPNPIPGSNFQQYLGPQSDCVFALFPISLKSLLSHINEIKPKTSAGNDLLSNKLIKLAIPSLAKPLLRLINLSLSTGYVPPQITVSKVIPLFKEGSKELFNNYRPIAIVSSVGKLLERVVCEQLTNYLESNELLSNHQYGFRSRHSVVHPLLQFSKKIFESLMSNNINLTIFIDLKKAFDTVNLDILLSKLSHYGILGKELQWFINYLKRSQQVFTGEALSEVITMLMGIPQGTCLGPILFILFINDLPCALQLFCQLFADDTTLQIEGPDIKSLFDKTLIELKKAENWFRCNKLTLNLKKTKFAVFGNDLQNLINIPDLSLSGVKIDRIGHNQIEKSVRFLGLWVGDTSTFSEHIGKMKLKIATGLYYLATAKLNSPLKVRLNIYRALIESCLRFAIIIYGSAPDQKIKELFILQKKAIRHIALAHFLAHTEPLFAHLKILKILDLISHSRASIVHQFRCGILPNSFSRDFFKFVDLTKQGRREDPLCVIIPKISNKSLERSPYLMICRAWNAVPYELKNISKHSEFKKALTEHYLSTYTEICSELNCLSCTHSRDLT